MSKCYPSTCFIPSGINFLEIESKYILDCHMHLHVLVGQIFAGI